MKHYDKFQNIHDLLKEYGCKQTYKWEKEYNEIGNLVCKNGTFFYETLEESKSEATRIKDEWREDIVAALDVVISTKLQGAERNEVRFDIEYSEKVKKYSMYISLTTHMKSISLSRDRYKNQDEIIAEIKKWLVIAKCKKANGEKKQKQAIWDFEQISMF